MAEAPFLDSWTPSHRLLRFVQMPGFTRPWKKLGLADADLRELEATILADPRAGAVLESSGGLRKLRFAPRRWGRGQSGATRVYYVFLEKQGVVLLMSIHAKNEKESITAAERVTIRQLIAEVTSLFQ